MSCLTRPGKLLAALFLLLLPLNAAAQTLEGTYTVTEIPTDLVSGPVPVSIYTPPGYDPERDKPYPLLIQLHGGGGTNDSMEQMSAMLEEAILSGRVEPVVSVMPSAGRSFYMNYADGSERWEDFITGDLIAHMRASYHVVPGREGTLITGISMGGMGALRIAFKHPETFQAVAALEPGIEPALAFDDLQLRDTFWRSSALFSQIFGDPVDKDYWATNNPATIAKNAPQNLKQLAIYLEAGDQDMLFLHHGTEFLHRVLFDAGISHEYRLVRGADHVGPSLRMRFLDAMSFMERVLDPPDWETDQVIKARHGIDALKRRAGYPVIDHDPLTLRTQ